MSNIYLIEVKTPYVTRLFKYWVSEPPTQEEVMGSHGEEAAGEVEAVNIYALDELAELPGLPESCHFVLFSAVMDSGLDRRGSQVIILPVWLFRNVHRAQRVMSKIKAR